MPSGNGISGQYGDAKISTTSIAEIGKWDFESKAKNAKYTSNKTLGYERTLPGTLSGSGGLTGFHDPTAPATAIIDAGTAVTLKLYINATQFYVVPACIDNFKLSIDIETGAIVGWTSSFSADGAWTNPVASGPIQVPPDLRRGPQGQMPTEAEAWRFEERFVPASADGSPQQIQTVSDPAVILSLTRLQEQVTRLATEVEAVRKIQLPSLDDVLSFRQELAEVRGNQQRLQEMQAWWEKQAAAA
jgi:hypothetical protein